MKLKELEDKLEDIQSELTKFYETTNLIYLVLSYGIATGGDVMCVLSDTVLGIKKTAEDVEKLIRETIKMRSTMEKL